LPLAGDGGETGGAPRGQEGEDEGGEGGETVQRVRVTEGGGADGTEEARG